MLKKKKKKTNTDTVATATCKCLRLATLTHYAKGVATLVAPATRIRNGGSSMTLRTRAHTHAVGMAEGRIKQKGLTIATARKVIQTLNSRSLTLAVVGNPLAGRRRRPGSPIGAAENSARTLTAHTIALNSSPTTHAPNL